MEEHAERWGVVGGGLLGLTLALRLAERGRRVTLIEAADHLGGLADAWQLGDVTWDRHYHVTLLSDRWLRGLLAELGLEDQMRWVETRTGFYTDGRLYSMSNSWEFLRFPPLKLVDKLRLAATIMYASRVKDWRALENVPVEDWLRRLSGRRTTEKIWLPLLRAKLGDNYRRTSAAFIWATIARMYAARRTGLKKEMFGYVPGGYARVLAALSKRLAERGVSIRSGYPVERIESGPSGGLFVRPQTGEPMAFDRVAVTAAAPLVARLCPQLSDAERTRFADVEYQGIVCASALLRKPLGGFYVTNITDDWVPFTAVIEMSALVAPDQLQGKHLVYLPKYLPAGHAMYDLGDDEIRGQFTAALLRMYPQLTADDVLAFRVSRARQVMPLPTLGYSQRLPAVETSIPGLFAVNSAHIVNGTLNVNETIKLAEQALPQLLSASQPAPQPTNAGSHESAAGQLVAGPGQ